MPAPSPSHGRRRFSFVNNLFPEIACAEVLLRDAPFNAFPKRIVTALRSGTRSALVRYRQIDEISGGTEITVDERDRQISCRSAAPQSAQTTPNAACGCGAPPRRASTFRDSRRNRAAY